MENTNNQDTKKNSAKALETEKNKGSGVIYRLNSVFPFDLFPDSIVIDHHKITVIKRYGPFPNIFFQLLWLISKQ